VAWRKVVDPHPGDAVVAEIRRHLRKQPVASALTACASRQVCHARRGCHVSGRSFYDQVYVHLDAIPHIARWRAGVRFLGRQPVVLNSRKSVLPSFKALVINGLVMMFFGGGPLEHIDRK